MGAGDETQLALNENSASYDYFLLNSDYGNIRVNYIYGYLESVPDSINRFITARGLEWSNKEDFLIGFSETVIYSGVNRSFDIGYLNPLSSHLEIELNNRLNVLGSANSNAVWQIHIDYLITDRIRFSGNYLYDEVVLDPDLEKGKENGTAYSYRIAYTPIILQKNMVTFYFTSIYVGTPTFRHASGINNFVHKSRPIGTLLGSDAKDIFLGLNYTNSKNLILLVKGGVQSSGEENILNRPYSTYENFQKGVFPSGLVDKAYYLNTYFRYFWNDYFSISFDCNLSKNQKNNFLYDFIFSLNLSRELSFKF